jgi:hypothetical protein
MVLRMTETAFSFPALIGVRIGVAMAACENAANAKNCVVSNNDRLLDLDMCVIPVGKAWLKIVIDVIEQQSVALAV